MISPLDPFHLEARVPPGAASVIFSNRANSLEKVAGKRDVKGFRPVKSGDLWHYGSVGKCMTSSMLAALVACGKLDWDETLIGTVNEAAGTPYESVTLRHLLSHRSGLSTDPSRLRLIRYLMLGGDPGRISAAMLQGALKQSAVFPAGTDFLYSNVGYGLAGLMAGRKTGQTFEELMRRHVFDANNLTSMEFGMPPQDGTAPLEHMPLILAKGWKTVQHGARVVDDLPLLRPSGCIHGTVSDLAAFGQAQLQMASGAQKSEIDAWRETHRPFGPPPEQGRSWRYGMGWFIDVADDVGARLWHAGSTGGCFAFLLLLPDMARGIALVANAFDAGWARPDSGFLSRVTQMLSMEQFVDG